METLVDLLIGTAWAQSAPPPGGGPLNSIVMIAGIFAIWYFLVIRPQGQQASKHKSLLASLGKGDKVVLGSGLHGKVVEVRDGTLLLEISKGVQVVVDKDKVARHAAAETNAE